MNILAAVKREEIKLEKQLGKLNHKSSGVRAAAKAVGRSAERDVIGVLLSVWEAGDVERRTAIVSVAVTPSVTTIVS